MTCGVGAGRRAPTPPAAYRRHIKADGTRIEVAIYTQSLSYARRSAQLVVAIDITGAQTSRGGARSDPRLPGHGRRKCARDDHREGSGAAIGGSC